MRKLVTAIAAAATLGLMAASAPAFADDAGKYRNDGKYQSNQHNDDRDQDHSRDRGKGARNFDFDRHEQSFDRWERDWGNQGFDEFRYQRPLPYWRLIRRIESQGYDNVRGLRKSRWGWGWRAFAFNYRGRPVMLQVNPYNGRVINARPVYARW